jgi:hypothetical protein
MTSLALTPSILLVLDKIFWKGELARRKHGDRYSSLFYRQITLPSIGKAVSAGCATHAHLPSCIMHVNSQWKISMDHPLDPPGSQCESRKELRKAELAENLRGKIYVDMTTWLPCVNTKQERSYVIWQAKK